MNDTEILAELERRIEEWFKSSGWSEENAGLRLVRDTIEKLRHDIDNTKDWYL